MTLDIRRLNRALQADAVVPAGLYKQAVMAGIAVVAVLLAAAPAAAKEAPIAPTAQEAAHFKAFDAAIAQVKAYDLATGEAERIRDCMKAIAAQDLTKALDIRSGIKDPVGLKIVNWYRLRGGYGQIGEYKAWLAENPAWPDAGILNQRYEELLFSEGGATSRVKDEFKDHPPKYGIGYAALATAELAAGENEQAKAHAVQAWRDMTVPPNLEAPFLERFGKLLTNADHKWRLDRLLMEDIRWASERGERVAAIRRQIARMPAGQQKIAEARLAVFQHEDGAKAEIDKVRNDAPNDTGLLYHLIQALRRLHKTGDAAKLILTAPTDPKLTPALDAWFEERRVLAYAELNSGNSKLAYDLVKAPGPLSVNPAKEQGFMAGLIALRYLNDPKLARSHFEAAAKAADGPLSRAKAGYWLGRIAELAGEATQAREYYQKAAREMDTFYGQLARLKLEPANRRLEIKYPAPPSADQVARFNGLDAVKAVVVAKKAGLDTAIPKLLVSGLRSYFDNETDVAMTLHLASSIGDTQLALKGAKAAIARGMNALVYSYPVHTFPKFEPLNVSPEPAFLLGVTRQETEFNKDTVSGAGAKGLMQVMKVTAEQVCHDYKFKCELDRLLPDTSYNAMLASAYIGDRIREFRGSYILGLSGFNAGPGRSHEWIRAFGDPRDASTDPLDWIERIPFLETREYVAKVLSNIQVYRARLGDEDNALQLDLDLDRGRAAGHKAVKPVPVPVTGAVPPNG